MEWEKVAEKLRDMILGEIKEEFRDFRASVSGELAGFRLAIESLNGRQANMENELRDIRRAIDDTNKRIDETNKRLDNTNKRIDETSKRMDKIHIDLITRIDEMNGKLNARMEEFNCNLSARMEKLNGDLNARMDNQNKRIDHLLVNLSEIRADLKKAFSDKEIHQ